LQSHIAGAAKLGKTGEGSLDEMFETIVALRTGEALVFSPDSVLDVVNASIGTCDTEIALKALLAKFVKVRIRNRISTDGGKSIMASDKIDLPILASDPQPIKTPMIADDIHTTRRIFHPQPDLLTVGQTGDTSDEEDVKPPTMTRGIFPLREAKREGTSSPSPKPYTPRPQSPAPFSNPPQEPAVQLPEPAKEPIPTEKIVRQLAIRTEAALASSSKNLDFQEVRCQVEDDLGIIDGSLSADGWKRSSKRIIKEAGVSR
jgi:hypothetical protein